MPVRPLVLHGAGRWTTRLRLGSASTGDLSTVVGRILADRSFALGKNGIWDEGLCRAQAVGRPPISDEETAREDRSHAQLKFGSWEMTTRVETSRLIAKSGLWRTFMETSSSAKSHASRALATLTGNR